MEPFYVTAVMLFCQFTYTQSSDPPGHMQPLGFNKPHLSVEILQEVPDPIEFFDRYVKPSKPVLFRGAAKTFPSFMKWKDDEYLKEKYGNWVIEAEVGKKETRKGVPVRMSYKNFLNSYNNSDIYLIQDILPTDAMAGDVFLPRCLLCSGFSNAIVTSVMWFSSGGTKSVLHNDDLENINCLYDGTKQLLLADKKYDDVVPTDRPDGHYSSVDVDKVDMYKYPTLSKVPWYKATLEAGDCFYIPYKWHHQVNSWSSRNLAINLWWARTPLLAQRDNCLSSLSEMPKYSPLSSIKLTSDSEVTRDRFYDHFFSQHDTITYENFMKLAQQQQQQDKTDRDQPSVEKLVSFFDEVDANKDRLLTAEELFSTPLKSFHMFDDLESDGDEKEEDVEQDVNKDHDSKNAKIQSKEDTPSDQKDPPGHMQPLGSHIAPLPVDVLEYWPDPLEFFYKYVKPGKPVLFRGGAKSFPSFSNWKNDEYLRSNYGDWKVEAEEGKKENRSKRTFRMTYREFLDQYNTSDIYLVEDILPDNPLADEVYIPRSLLCGGMTDYLNLVVMWFSSGGTKSVLHNDAFENINCVYDGSKKMVLIDKKHKDLVPIDKEGSHSSVDVDQVDMYKYPTLSQVPWYQTTIDAGDCFYIPIFWFHQVNSMTSRNLAINLWWTYLYDLPKKQSCLEDASSLPSFAAVSNFKFAPLYETHRSWLFQYFDQETNTTTCERIKQAWFEEVSDEKNAEEFLKKIDTDNDCVITVDEVYAIDGETLTEYLGSDENYENTAKPAEAVKDEL